MNTKMIFVASIMLAFGASAADTDDSRHVAKSELKKPQTARPKVTVIAVQPSTEAKYKVDFEIDIAKPTLTKDVIAIEVPTGDVLTQN